MCLPLRKRFQWSSCAASTLPRAGFAVAARIRPFRHASLGWRSRDMALRHLLLVLSVCLVGPAFGQVERLYILNCGEGVAGDISRWSPGVNVGKSQPFADSCYLIKHAQGWMLWDTGLPDALAAKPAGE